eukprot:CAMPEP_0119002852 /NCGR_PEP_ID=MMETSP1176-20130426/176_1 /TAXON_ID=265551 /ORGANISM="Synedropsis recta cf, Strain CCMP1620" /LENGTH=65 /DNA_ID=CAMNT_0006954383 /DNA_START=102 /DNA_END=302 /DNA_ORIENTATION=+
MAKSKKQEVSDELKLSTKDGKKVAKLEAMIPYHAQRSQPVEVEKLQQKIDAIWEKARSSRDLALA